MVMAGRNRLVSEKSVRGSFSQSTSRRNYPACPASSSWQGFFGFEVGDSGVGEAEVDIGGPVPGDRFVRSDVVVVGPVGVDLVDEFEPGIDLLAEQPLIFHRAEAAFA